MTIKETIEEAKKDGVKDMSWKAWFMIITIISAATVASYYGVNVTMNLDLANRVGSLEDMLSHTINSTFYTLQKQASYIISIVKSGATTYYCMQNGTTGTLDFWSTNASQVSNYARGNLSSLTLGAAGTLYYKTGHYSIDTQIILGHKTHVTAEPDVWFDVTANLGTGVFVIDNTDLANTDWAIDDVNIDLNSYATNGIYSLHASQTSLQTRSRMHNLFIQECKSGYANINLTNVKRMDAQNIRIRSNQGNGIVLLSTGLDNEGDSYWSNILVSQAGSNTIALDIIANSTSKATMSNAVFVKFQVATSSGTSGNVGVRIVNDHHITFYSPFFDYTDIAFLLDGARHINIYDTQIGVLNAGDTAFLINGSSVESNLIHGGEMFGAATNYINDTSTGGPVNVFEDFDVQGATVTVSSSNSVFYHCPGYDTEKYGSHASTVSGHTISHSLEVTPIIVTVTTDNVGIFGTVTAIGATTFTVGLSWYNGTAVDTSNSPCTVLWHALGQP